MKKNNFYKKAGFILAMVAGTCGQVLAQTDRTFKNDQTLIIRTGDILSYSNTINADSIAWHWSSGQKSTSSSVVITNQNPVLYVYKKDTIFYAQFYGGPLLTHGDGSFAYPFKQDTSLIEVNVLEISIDQNYWKSRLIQNPIWGVKYDNGDSATFTGTSVTMTKNASVTLYGTVDGLWYKQNVYFSGIFQDPTSGSLNAPIVENATYTWYRNGYLFNDIKTATFTPTELGTYKVVMTWISSTNLRTEESTTNTATFVFEVKSLPILTNVENASLENTINAIYPNPASDVAYINAKGTFEYSIETANAELVSSGTGNDQVRLDLQAMNAGVYFIRIKTNEKQSVNRLVVR